MKIGFVVLALALLVGGCSHRSSVSVERAGTAPSESLPATALSQILITPDDITDRDYQVIADIEASVSKTTAFNSDPTRDMIDQELREEASKLGADAVILVRYGTVGISAFSWGTLDGWGRAVHFLD